MAAGFKERSCRTRGAAALLFCIFMYKEYCSIAAGMLLHLYDTCSERSFASGNDIGVTFPETKC